MQRLLAYLLLLVYAGAFLHCQVRAQGPGVAAVGSGPARGVCKKGGPVARASAAEVTFSKATPHGPALLPVEAWANLLLALHYPVRTAGRVSAASLALPVAGVFANHPNKAPPVRFS